VEGGGTRGKRGDTGAADTLRAPPVPTPARTGALVTLCCPAVRERRTSGDGEGVGVGVGVGVWDVTSLALLECALLVTLPALPAPMAAMEPDAETEPAVRRPTDRRLLRVLFFPARLLCRLRRA